MAFVGLVRRKGHAGPHLSGHVPRVGVRRRGANEDNVVPRYPTRAPGPSQPRDPSRSGPELRRRPADCAPRAQAVGDGTTVFCGRWCGGATQGRNGEVAPGSGANAWPVLVSRAPSPVCRLQWSVGRRCCRRIQGACGW